MTPSEAAKAVAVLVAVYPNARFSKPTVDAYEMLLSDLEFELVRTAITRLCCTSKFLPTVAEIREAVAELTLGPRRNGVDAWGDVLMAIRRVGSYGYPKFEDPLVSECVRLMGWRNLCLADVPEATDRARFCELYQDLQRKQRTVDLSEPGRLLPHATRFELPAHDVDDLLRDVAQGPVQSDQGKTGTEKARRS